MLTPLAFSTLLLFLPLHICFPNSHLYSSSLLHFPKLSAFSMTQVPNVSYTSHASHKCVQHSTQSFTHNNPFLSVFLRALLHHCRKPLPIFQPHLLPSKLLILSSSISSRFTVLVSYSNHIHWSHTYAWQLSWYRCSIATTFVFVRQCKDDFSSVQKKLQQESFQTLTGRSRSNVVSIFSEPQWELLGAGQQCHMLWARTICRTFS